MFGLEHLNSARQCVESTQNLFAGDGLRQLFGYTWLKSAEVGLNVGKAVA